jgi:hypothetical protein
MIVDPAQQGRKACGGAADLIESHHAPAIAYCASVQVTVEVRDCKGWWHCGYTGSRPFV